LYFQKSKVQKFFLQLKYRVQKRFLDFGLQMGKKEDILVLKEGEKP
jgi:hypothetical protein